MKIIYQYERQGLDKSYLDPSCHYRSKRNLNAGDLLGYDGDLTFSDGFVLYEVLPQKRMMFIPSLGSDRSVVSLPYLYFGLRYFKSDNGNGYYRDGSYIYPASYHGGLQLCCSLNPVQSFDDKVAVMPTDILGHICADHKYDYSEYKNLDELSSRIIGSWYGYHHAWGDYGKLKDMNWDWDSYWNCYFEQASILRSLKDFLTMTKFSAESRYKCVVIPDDAKIVRDK